MDKMEFDKTRKAINVEKLKETDRREMLDKFHEAGGKVLNEKSLAKPPAVSDESGQKKSSQGGTGSSDTKLPSELAREKHRKEAEIIARARIDKERQGIEARSFGARFMIKLKCRLKGLTPFASDMVTPRFMSVINLDLKRAVMECHILANDLFGNDPKTAARILQALDEKHPLMAELLDRASDLYDRNLLNDLTQYYNSNPDMLIHLGSIKVSLFAILRKIYYLKPFQESYLKAAETAIDVQQAIEKKQSNFYAIKKRKIRSDWNTLMNDIFPSLVLLAQRAEMMRAEPFTELFEDMIGASKEERPGIRKAGEPLKKTTLSVRESSADEIEIDVNEDLTEEEQETKDTFFDENEDVPQADEFSYGNKLLQLFPLNEIRKKLDARNEWSILKNEDKILITYLLFRIFEDEFSFVLSSSKIQMNSFQGAGNRVDLKRTMAVTLDRSHNCHDGFRKYLREATEYHRVETESTSSVNYVEHAKLISMLEGRRGTAGRQFKTSIQEFMAQIRSLLNPLIEDMKGSSKIVLNVDEVITFDLPGEATKRLNGKSVKQCLFEAYAFASALARQLEGGYLYGGVIEMNPEEFSSIFLGAREEPDPMDIPF